MENQNNVDENYNKIVNPLFFQQFYEIYTHLF